MQGMIPSELPPCRSGPHDRPVPAVRSAACARACAKRACVPRASACPSAGCSSPAANRHVSAEMVFDEAMKARVPVSLATVYNTQHQFTQAGLLREVAVEGAKSYFDTNTDAHQPFLHRGRGSPGRFRCPAR